MVLARGIERDLIAGIGVAHDAGGGVVPQDTLEFLARCVPWG